MERTKKSLKGCISFEKKSKITVCYRVVNAKGELAGEFAFGGARKQGELLEAEGIEVIDGKVDLNKYQWKS